MCAEKRPFKRPHCAQTINHMDGNTNYREFVCKKSLSTLINQIRNVEGRMQRKFAIPSMPSRQPFLSSDYFAPFLVVPANQLFIHVRQKLTRLTDIPVSSTAGFSRKQKNL